MDALWAAGRPLTVRETLENLNDGRTPPLAYTTVLTVMQRLAGKGALTRTVRGRGHAYAPGVALLGHARRRPGAGRAARRADGPAPGGAGGGGGGVSRMHARAPGTGPCPFKELGGPGHPGPPLLSARAGQAPGPLHGRAGT